MVPPRGAVDGLGSTEGRGSTDLVPPCDAIPVFAIWLGGCGIATYIFPGWGGVGWGWGVGFAATVSVVS